jgi:methionyl-tRNA formyltransferase
MNIVFFGTSGFAANILSDLISHRFNISAVVTRPDRQKGRSLHSSPPPVKQLVEKIAPEVPVFQPEKASTDDFARILESFHADLFVVVAFGEIIKKNLLSLPKLGCINIHASLLPKYRGAAPMQRALMDGVTETGITIIEMVLQMDAGDIIAMESIPVPQEMTFGELEEKLCHLACRMIKEVIQKFEQGKVTRIPQNHREATLAPKITPEEERIDWKKSAHVIHNQIRALSPRPGAWCLIKINGEEKRLKIKRSEVVDHLTGQAGSILFAGKEKGLVIACGDLALRLLEVQLEGKKTMSAEEFLRGIQNLILNPQFS